MRRLFLLLFMAAGLSYADISALKKRAYHGCFFNTWDCVERGHAEGSLEMGKECIESHEACAIETCKINTGGAERP